MEIKVATHDELKEFMSRHALCSVRDHKLMVTEYDNRVELSCDWHGEQIVTTIPYGLFCFHPVKCAGRRCCSREYSCCD